MAIFSSVSEYNPSVSISAPPTSVNFLNILLEFGQAFQSELQLEPLLNTILQHLQTILDSDGGSIWLLNDVRTELVCRYAIGPDTELVLGQKVDVATLASLVTTLGKQTLNWKPESQTGALAAGFIQQLGRPGLKSLLVAPLLASGEFLGMINMVNKNGAAAFSEEERLMLQALAGHSAIAIYTARLNDQRQRANERQQLLEQIRAYFQSTLDIDLLIPRIFDEVNKAIQAEGQSIWLLDADGEHVTCDNATGANSASVVGLKVSVHHSIVGNCVLRREPILVADAQNDPRFNRDADSKTGLTTRSLMSVPMVRQGKAIGALQAINKQTGGLFGQDDLYLFNSIASSAALAIENARLFQELQASYDLTLYALTAALDLRDRETEGHSQRVVAYTLRLARELKLGSESMEHLRRGALLHDVGKIGVPDRILLKPAALDADERKEIEKHPQKGYEMLLGIPPLAEAIKVVLAHHERWDGQGYPLGLRADTAPLGARLFSVADTFDALTSDRPYRSRRPYEVARKIIEDEAGKQFDPKVVEAFLAVPPHEWDEIRAGVMRLVERRRQEHEALIQAGHQELRQNTLLH